MTAHGLINLSVPCPDNANRTATRPTSADRPNWDCTCGRTHHGVICPECGHLAQPHDLPDVEQGWLLCPLGHWVCRRREPCPDCGAGMAVGRPQQALWTCEVCRWQELR
jgi:hypothetical protein